MNSTDKILYHSFTAPFYRQIAGALLFLFFLLFGIQQSLKSALQFHYYIIVSIINNPVGTAILSGGVILFALKCISFFSACMQKESYGFVKILNGINIIKRYAHLGLIALSLLAPALIYGLVVFIIALKIKNYLSAFWVMALLLTTILFTTRYFIFSITRAPSIKIKKIWLFERIKIPKNLSWFLLSYLLRKQFRVFIIVKLVSFLALYFFVMHDSAVFEERMLWLIFLLTVIAHGVIVYRNFYFLENEMNFYRNLPFKDFEIIVSISLVYIIICLPEWWALRALGFMHGNWYSYTCMIAGGPAILLLLHTLLYTEDISMDSFLPLLFGIWLLFFFFSFSNNKWLVPAVALFGAVIVFYTSFRKYEKRSEVEKLD